MQCRSPPDPAIIPPMLKRKPKLHAGTQDRSIGAQKPRCPCLCHTSNAVSCIWRISKSSLVELVGETADAADAVGAVAVRVLILCLKFALREQIQESAVDRVVQVEFDLSAWRLYLFHTCQAIGGLLYREHLSCVLLHGTIALPQLQRRIRTIRLDVRSEVRSALLPERVLQCG